MLPCHRPPRLTIRLAVVGRTATESHKPPTRRRRQGSYITPRAPSPASRRTPHFRRSWKSAEAGSLRYSRNTLKKVVDRTAPVPTTLGLAHTVLPPRCFVSFRRSVSLIALVVAPAEVPQCARRGASVPPATATPNPLTEAEQTTRGQLTLVVARKATDRRGRPPQRSALSRLAWLMFTNAFTNPMRTAPGVSSEGRST